MKVRIILTLLLSAGLATGCAAPRAGAGAGVGSGDTLLRAELEAADQQDLYRLIASLRPHWLTSRGPTSFSGASSGPSVFLDGARVGGVDYLRNLPPSSIEEVRFWPSSDAATRFGLGHPDGVIDLKTRR